MTSPKSLPIDDHLPEIKRHLEVNLNVLVRAAPGTGKTTRIPPFLSKLMKGKVLVLEPRRIAAKLSAFRVAEENNWIVGKQVGYKFRQENKTSTDTQLIFLTEGLLLRQMINDPQLSGVSVVILDEFHERHLHGDVALAMLRRLQKTTRPDLKILVMSATLEIERLPDYLETTSVLEIPGQMYPVQEIYLAKPPTKSLPETVVDCLKNIEPEGGDILVFLPGKGEIQNILQKLETQRLPNTIVLPLHGDLSVSQQQMALEPIEGQRRIILSTNIAETSVTIQGVRIVVDSGLHRRVSFSPWSGIPKLELKSISRASAIQRLGRAGRLGPGTCYRLYTKADFQSRLEFEQPEIQRVDLLSTALELYALGVDTNESFPWFEAPREANWSAANESLKRLGLISGGKISDFGKQVASLPLPPRLAMAMHLANERKVGIAMAPLLVGLAEGEIESVDPDHPLEIRLGNKTERAIKAIHPSGSQKPSQSEIEEILFLAFADRVAKFRRRTAEKVDFTMAFGGSVEMSVAHPLVRKEPQFLVVLEAFQASGTSNVKIAAGLPISKRLVENHRLLETKERIYWDKERKRIQKVSGLYFGEISVMETEEGLSDDDLEIANKILISDGLALNLEKLTSDALLIEQLNSKFSVSELKTQFARMKCVLKSNLLPELIFPDNWLAVGLRGCVSISELEHNDWIRKWLDDTAPGEAMGLLNKIERLVPESIQLGSRRVKINYELDQNPWVESRIQDFFGMKEGPSILNGRLLLTLHLLAPNQRAVQVTQSLSGFWQNHYPKIRQELGRRYPKHKWPMDPVKGT